MKVLLLGSGMQGKAALHDLAHNPEVKTVVAADRDIDSLEAFVGDHGLGSKVACAAVDAAEHLVRGRVRPGFRRDPPLGTAGDR